LNQFYRIFGGPASLVHFRHAGADSPDSRRVILTHGIFLEGVDEDVTSG
jgi:hypothetical protein